ncbi:MAG: hypothetical protein KDC98_08990, partial [Planctomycetes bacterium]|nr:hypothetical protein [Planctomycetota bacterium]
IALAREIDAPLPLVMASIDLATAMGRPFDLRHCPPDAATAAAIVALLEPTEAIVNEVMAVPRITVYWQQTMSKSLAVLGQYRRAQELSWLAADTERWLARREATAALALYREERERAAAVEVIRHERRVRDVFLVASGILMLMAVVLLRLFLSHRRAHRRVDAINNELQAALSQVKRLSGFLPICARCKSVRDDEGYWQAIDGYLSDHSEAHISHGICPQCAAQLYPNLNLSDDEPGSAR